MALAWNLHSAPNMDDKTYLTRATAIALLMLGSIATVVITAQRSPSAGTADTPAASIAQLDTK